MDGCGSLSIRNVRELAYKFLDFGRDLIFLYKVLSSKLNCITFLTGISHEKLMVFHRWTSWAMFVLALGHTFPFIVVHIQKGDMML
jgi:hypothetical protein